MTPKPSADGLLRALNTLKASAYQPGTTKEFTHINYCQWCSYAESHPHGDDCPVTLITAHLSAAESGGWIKCSERLPTEADGDENGNVLTALAHKNRAHQKSIASWTLLSMEFPDDYWQPLPPLPDNERSE